MNIQNANQQANPPSPRLGKRYGRSSRPRPPLVLLVRTTHESIGRIPLRIIAQAAQHEDHVILLATRIPQELATGLGIQLGQRRRDWPRHLYPVFYENSRLVVPDFELGAESTPAERT